MKKTPLFFFLFCILSLFASGCSWFGKLNTIEYNNEIVEVINETSTRLEKTATLYNETIPDLVTEQSAIDITEMKTEFDLALTWMNETNTLLSLEGKNLEQQNAVRNALETYQDLGTSYLTSYQTMLNYYENETYKEEIQTVEVLDKQLHSDYTAFIQTNNDLVNTLETFVAQP